MTPHDLSLRDLISNAHVLADSLQVEGRPHAAGLILELVKRTIPVKLVPTRGKPIVAVSLLDSDLPAGVDLSPPVVHVRQWCDQCERRVTESCTSPFCKVRPCLDLSL